MSTHKPINLDIEATTDHHAYSTAPGKAKLSKVKTFAAVGFCLGVAGFLAFVYWPSSGPANTVPLAVQEKADSISKAVREQSEAFAASQPPAPPVPPPATGTPQPVSKRDRKNAVPPNQPK